MTKLSSYMAAGIKVTQPIQGEYFDYSLTPPGACAVGACKIGRDGLEGTNHQTSWGSETSYQLAETKMHPLSGEKRGSAKFWSA